MIKVKVEDAVGMVLAHDLTKIVPGKFKGAAFKKGHIVQATDIEELKNIGKNYLYILPFSEEQVHENEAARRIAVAASSDKLNVLEPLEGKANIRPAYRGLLKIKQETLSELNQLGEIALVTLHNNTLVEADQPAAAAKIIPLVIAREKIQTVEEICRKKGPVIDIKPLFPLKTGIVITGSEVYYGRIEDRFGEALRKKVNYYGGEVFDLRYAPDDLDFIAKQIRELLEKGAEVILLSGGMAVDADDITPQAIREIATELVTYGLPVLPGAMCMVAYHRQVPIIGIPACAMFSRTTILDIILPRLLAKEHLRKEDLFSLAHGGMCLQCDLCRYPACPFGK